jgi:hypothetical protein
MTTDRRAPVGPVIREIDKEIEKARKMLEDRKALAAKWKKQDEEMKRKIKEQSK